MITLFCLQVSNMSTACVEDHMQQALFRCFMCIISLFLQEPHELLPPLQMRRLSARILVSKGLVPSKALLGDGRTFKKGGSTGESSDHLRQAFEGVFGTSAPFSPIFYFLAMW